MDKSIVIVTRSMCGGGAERVIAQLANYFVEQSIQCTLITIDDDKISYDLHSKIKIISIGKKSDNKALDKYKKYTAVRKIIKAIRPKVVLSMPEEIGVYVILALLGLHIPVYVSERNNPWVMPDVKVTRILRKLMYPFAKGIIFQTEMAKSFFSPAIQKKGVVIGNPVDAARIPEPYQGKRRKMIVGAGRLEKQKNFPLLISAFAEFSKEKSDYELVIYGEGRLREQLEQQINQLGLNKKVHLPGRMSNLLELMNDCAMFVLSSDYEGMPNVLIEAMCMGMPVIATDCPSGGPRELIQNGENGILVSVNQIEEMVDGMKRLTNPEVQVKLGERAYRTSKKLMNTDVFEKWGQVLQINRNRGSV